MISAIIFDCFGVLQLGANRALEEAFPDKSKELGELTRQGHYGFINKAEFIAAAVQITDSDYDTVLSIVVEKYHYNEALANFIIRDLKPKYKIGLLSNIGRGWMENFIDEHQLGELFDAVVLSGDEGVMKPHPQSYELIAERLGHEPEECLMIDDLPENIAGADAAGMTGIVYGNLRTFKQDLATVLERR